MRHVNNQILLDMAKDIKPAPKESLDIFGGVKSPKGKAKPSKSKETVTYGPMPSFEREIQKIIAEQVSFNVLTEVQLKRIISGTDQGIQLRAE